MPEYSVKNGIYYVALSRAEVEEFIQYARSFENIKPSLNAFARRQALQANILDDKAEVIVDFSGIFTEKEPTNLIGLNFNNIDLTGVKFSGANMQGCRFENAILDSADFKGAILDKAVFKNCRARGANFVQAKLNNVIIDNSDLGGAFLTESESDLLKIDNKSNLNQALIKNINWSEVIINDSNLRSAQLDNAKIDRLEINNCDLRQSSFNDSEITTLVAENCDFKQSNLDNANVAKAIIRDSDFSNCSMKNAKMPRAELRNVKLNNVNASGINLHEAVIKSDCQLKNVDLSAADLSYADLNGCTISNSDLTTANLLKANIEGGSISRVRQDKAWYKPSSETLIKSTVGASKVALGASKVVTSGAQLTKNMFSKLWGSSAPVAQEAEVAQNDVSKQSHSQHYNNIVNAITSTRLIAEDFVQAKSFVENITKVVAGLFDQDYFFPRANNYQVLVEQIEKAHAKGYIDTKYGEEFISELRQIEIDDSKDQMLPLEVLQRLILEVNEIESGEVVFEELQKLLADKQNAEVVEWLREIMPKRVEEEINKLKESKIAEMQQYYTNRHAKFTNHMLKARVEQLAKEGILSTEEKEELNKQLRDKTGQFEEKVNQALEKKILIKSAEKLKPLLHVLSDPKLFKITELLGVGQNREATLAIWDNLKDVISVMSTQLNIDNPIAVLRIDDKLLQYVGIVPSIVSLIIPMMKYGQEFPVILSGLQDMFRAPRDLDHSQALKSPDQTMHAIRAICALLQQDPELRRSFSEEIEKMTKVLTGIFAKKIQSIDLEVDFIDQLTTLSTKLARAENSEIFGLFAAGIAMMQDPQSAFADMQKDENYSQLKNIVQKVLPRFIENQNADIRSLIEGFLMKTIKGSEINNKIAAALGVDATKSLELLDGYLEVASSVVRIAGVMMNHQDEFLEIIKFFTTKEPTSEQYLQAVSAGMRLLSQKNVRDIISQELPKIFAATNGVLEAKLKSFGLSQEFAAQAVNLVSKVVASDDIGKILEFAQGIVNKEMIEARGDYPKLFELFVTAITEEEKYTELKEVIQTSLPSLLSGNKENINRLIAEFLQNTTMGQQINQRVAAALGVDASKALELQAGYLEVASSVVRIAGVMMNHQDECLELIKFFATTEPTSEQYAQVLSAGISLLRQKNVREAISQELPKILDLTKDVLEAKLESFGLSKEFAVQAVSVVSDIIDSDEMGKILEFAAGIVNKEIIDAYRNDLNKLPKLLVQAITEEEKYTQLKGIIQTSLLPLLASNKDNINALIGEFLNNTTMGQQINKRIADALGVDASKALELQAGYLEVASSVVRIAGVMMNHQDECLELMRVGQGFLKGTEVTVGQYLQAATAAVKLLKQQDVRSAISQELPKILDLTKDVLEAKLKSFGLSKEFAVQAVSVVSDIIDSDEMGKILEFAEGIINKEMIEARADYPKLFELFINSIKDEKKYNQLKGIIQKSLLPLLESNKDNINALIGEFLNNTTMGQQINKRIADVLGIDENQRLALQSAYLQVASSAVHIAGAMMNHKTDFRLLVQAGQKLLTGDKVDMSDYLQAIASAVKLLKQQDVRVAIGQELPNIFAATNIALEGKLKSFGLSHNFAEQSVGLVAKVVASDEMGKILEFANDLLRGGITLDKKGKMSPSEVMNQLIEDIRGGNYKSGFQGFVSLVGNAGKYKEFRTLVQETLPALITQNKDQIAPLMEEFIKNTALGKRINIDVNDILKIASKKNKNFLDLAKCWAEGSYSGVLKETVKLLTSPMVAGFLLEIAAKMTFSYLFKGEKEEERPAQVPEMDVPVVKKVEHVWQAGVKKSAHREPEIIIGTKPIIVNLTEQQKERHSTVEEKIDSQNQPKKSSKKSNKSQEPFNTLEKTDQQALGEHANNFKPRVTARPEGVEYRRKKINSRSGSHTKNLTEEREHPDLSVKGK